MCGIIGALKTEGNAVVDCISVLKKLEYRGYDSAGMAIKLYQEQQNVGVC